MVTGAVIAGATDLTYSLPGYVYVAICAVSTAVYLLLIRLLKDKTGVLSAKFHHDLLVCWQDAWKVFMAMTRNSNLFPADAEQGYRSQLCCSTTMSWLCQL